MYPQKLNKLCMLKIPKSHQKQELMAHVSKTSADDEVRARKQENLDSDCQLLDFRGSMGVRFDEHGMILPHTILGSLEDYRSYLEAKGETELVKRIPNSLGNPLCEAKERSPSDAVETETLSSQRNIQGNALQNWDKHVRHRRQQQDFLSDLLHRPVEKLLMNQANHYRETQEQREFLNRVMPLIHSGYGYRVGSEFWSLPQRYGDEMSGITATLTQTEWGRQKPITQMGQPQRICQESGIICAETLRPASRTWSQSTYLHHQRQLIKEVLQDMDINKPDISELVVIGSGKPSYSPSLENEEEEMESKQNLDPLAQHEDVHLDVPTLRFCGQVATWTGNSLSKQGEVGISATIFFEALTGEIVTSHLDLHNEGSTVIFYSWQQLPKPYNFPNLGLQTQKVHFYFNASSGVILPGETQRVEFLFKSEKPVIKTEIWQLSTHPVLLQGASMQVVLRGISLYQDRTADERLFIETKLEKVVQEKICRSIVYEVLYQVHSPERPSSPAELYITTEQLFLSRNPKLQYRDVPVEGLKALWQKLDQGSTWDYSVDTLRQALLSLPDEESSQGSLTREEGLAQLNSLYLQLSEPSGLNHPLTAGTLGRQLWRKLLDRMTAEAMWLQNLLGLPEKEAWTDKEDKLIITDAGEIQDKKGEREKETGKGHQGKTTKIKGTLENQENESESILQPPPKQTNVVKMMPVYTRLLHSKVYALMEDLVDNLCDLMDELNMEDVKDTHY
ncbi:MYCBP-associated protein isoform X1 [Neolamprologus brichardi]|uniref:MYCBP-associated protein isoform X1 n=2 Tax=Neolamprologus brichardi TaxID=32507 RepID=UPI0003EBEB91|nr:MYCBP-associated protein isoform X1 [Neolamprologus brichardi]